MSAEPLVRLNDFQTQWRNTRTAVLGAVERVGRSGWFILGKEVQRFEEQLAQLTGVNYAIGCASGLDAIEIGLRVLGLKPGSQVLTTPLSAFATTLAIIRAGGQPLFVDVDETGLLNLDLAERLLKSNESEAQFLLPVHLYGHSCDLSHLAQLKQRFGIRIVEDCAQAICAESAGTKVGSIGDVAALSFYPTKNLGAMGDGGALLTRDSRLAEAARILRDYGQSAKYLHTVIGLNSRLDELQAAIMTDAAIPGLPEQTNRRRAIASYYRKRIAHPLITIPSEPQGSKSVYHLFPTLVNAGRESFQQHLRAAGIETAVHYPTLIPDQPALQSCDFTVCGSLDNARRFVACEVSLPAHPYMTQRELERVVIACNSWKG